MEGLGLVLILYFAYIADFKLQDRNTATKKSTDINVLTYHVSILVSILVFPCWLVFGLKYGAAVGLTMAMFFSVINGVIHGIIDWNIWKGYKKKVYKEIKAKLGDQEEWVYKNAANEFQTNKDYAEDPEFYNTIGFDGYLHVATIVLLYTWFI